MADALDPASVAGPEPCSSCGALPCDQAAGGDSLAWFSGQRRLELYHYSPVYGDDDDQSDEWRVSLQSGPINDREWETVGRGETAGAAIEAARAHLLAQQEQTDAH